jgi:YesN/AraC family two-component response regulator
MEPDSGWKSNMELINEYYPDISILCVEDDPISRHYLCRIISIRFPGQKLHVAGNGLLGLELFREFRADIVLTDISMPVMDGIRLAREIRALSPHAYIIALSAHSNLNCPPDEVGFLFDQHLLKPVDRKQLIEIIHNRVTGIFPVMQD